MSTDSNDPANPQGDSNDTNSDAHRVIDLPIEEELKNSYLTYAMSVIVSRALPDVQQISDSAFTSA